MRRGILLFIVVCLALPAVSADASESLFIHLTANFKESDGPVCVAFNVAWRALREGYEVEIFFDQDAAYGIKQWERGRTDLGIYPLPENLKDLLAEAFEVDHATIPADYQRFLMFLSDQGATVTVNGLWNALTQVEETIKGRKNILPFVEPLTLQELLQHRKAATIYLKF